MTVRYCNDVGTVNRSGEEATGKLYCSDFSSFQSLFIPFSVVLTDVKIVSTGATIPIVHKVSNTIYHIVPVVDSEIRRIAIIPRSSSNKRCTVADPRFFLRSLCRRSSVVGPFSWVMAWLLRSSYNSQGK